MKPEPEKMFPWGTQPRRLYEALAGDGEKQKNERKVS